jgi:hypothetical protein
VAGTYSIETVVDVTDLTAEQCLFGAEFTGDIHQTNGVLTPSSGTVYVNGAVSTALPIGCNHIIVSGIALDMDSFTLMVGWDGLNHTNGQLPMWKLHEGTLDAETVTKLWDKADNKYNISAILVDGTGTYLTDGAGNILVDK